MLRGYLGALPFCTQSICFLTWRADIDLLCMYFLWFHMTNELQHGKYGVRNGVENDSNNVYRLVCFQYQSESIFLLPELNQLVYCLYLLQLQNLL